MATSSRWSRTAAPGFPNLTNWFSRTIMGSSSILSAPRMWRTRCREPEIDAAGGRLLQRTVRRLTGSENTAMSFVERISPQLVTVSSASCNGLVTDEDLARRSSGCAVRNEPDRHRPGAGLRRRTRLLDCLELLLAIGGA